jgi:hypothetical protein
MFVSQGRCQTLLFSGRWRQSTRVNSQKTDTYSQSLNTASTITASPEVRHRYFDVCCCRNITSSFISCTFGLGHRGHPLLAHAMQKREKDHRTKKSTFQNGRYAIFSRLGGGHPTPKNFNFCVFTQPGPISAILHRIARCQSGKLTNCHGRPQATHCRRSARLKSVTRLAFLNATYSVPFPTTSCTAMHRAGRTLHPSGVLVFIESHSDDTCVVLLDLRIWRERQNVFNHLAHAGHRA